MSQPELVRVNLSASEMMAAALIGISRHVSAVKRGLRMAHGIDPDNAWSAHIEGACGEAAFAKAANVFWTSSVNTFKEGGDVRSVQVRTRSKHGYELLVRDGDADDSVFVLVTGRAPSYVVRGWIMGRDAKRREWSQSHGGREAAYFVPHSALLPVTAIPSEALA